MYTFEEDKLITELNQKKPKRVLLQLPEGIKREGLRISNLIREKTLTEVILSGEPLWGACDVAVNEAKTLGCEMIIIYGHAKFVNSDFPILYLEARYESDITKIVKKSLPKLESFKKIALATSVQHIHQIPQVTKLIEETGLEVIVPEAKGNAFYDGQVLGCEYSSFKLIADKVDAVVIVANKFHALGVAMSINKPVILVDPFNEEIHNMDEFKDKIIRQRFAAIEKAKQAKKIGIIIGTKLGQKFGSFEFVKEKLKKINKEYVMISMSEITNDKLINLYDIEAFVELACPRIAIDAAGMFDKPLLTAREFAVLCGDLEWNDLLEKGFL
ncbi:diphthamide biosynthesis enzyme Dph2 [Candidatus Woesearchaeota archaeon]|jgi:2-(3-amino-3-carboxypropyl)histidine synthase|nr:diphthamide biosynthesis enzyme Dph2 [Candidatus Woesearchaeota archaeon]MBT3438540.1 diphthamide biosynthesis enzyme Dph2 [Candidatus Woesearchaeota archaeon]MBT4058337.1 diphthamide biosynthesis enzyme Dph2 [Candidatus Woesearchaeota archaeon]MBT4208061.1 diphthamide biosynthesis enzyme Dph2 [Candidatus Woesearchaeota archaeon]MBT4732041.1 diphthamide biosynthesis enzyme Dph2 [Candidatus Woesearchaeota archaeon]